MACSSNLSAFYRSFKCRIRWCYFCSSYFSEIGEMLSWQWDIARKKINVQNGSLGFHRLGTRHFQDTVISLCSLMNVQGKSVSVSWAWLINIRPPRVNTAPVLYCLSTFRGHLLYVDIKEENWKVFSLMSLFTVILNSRKERREIGFLTWKKGQESFLFCSWGYYCL